MKNLTVIDSAFSPIGAPSDDTVAWLVRLRREQQPDATVLLRGEAVECAIDRSDACPCDAALHLDERAEEIRRLVSKGVPVKAVKEDLHDRGFRPLDLIEGVETVSRRSVMRLIESHDQVWHC